MKSHIRFSSLLTCLFIFAFAICATCEEKPEKNWHVSNLPFRAINITSNGSTLWACGSDESLAVSSDNGMTWNLKHHQPDGNLLLNVQFSGETFGYAAGTGGLLLTTENSGETWISHPGGNATILQVAFADAQHGLIRTPESLLSTANGGKTWSAVSASESGDVLKSFPFSFSLAVLDPEHMAVMLKHGAAQYEPQTFLVSRDAGNSWQVVNIPNVTLYSFLASGGRYWAIGTEVIHKDQPGGGYAVPMALYSSDGMQWTHSTSDLSACKLEMCVACTAQGCLSSNNTITNVFPEKPGYWTFPSSLKLTPKWSATGSTMCFVGSTLECTAITSAAQAAKGDRPVPAAVAPGPIGGKTPQGPRCIVCEVDHFLVDQKVQGAFIIKLAINIGKNGTVTAVQVEDAPTPEIRDRIEQQAHQWIFEPYTKDGARIDLKLNTKIQVNVIRPR